MSSIVKPIIVVLLIGVGVFGQYRYRLVERYFGKYVDGQKITSSASLAEIFGENGEVSQSQMAHFWQAWQLLEQNYLETDKLNPTDMIDGAVRGLTSSLGDPYTAYLPPEENQRSGEDLAGSFSGVGIELGYVDQVLAVVAPLKDSPAEEAGLEAGDLILKVEDPIRNFAEETTDWSLEKAVQEIRGPEGSMVIFTILRPDEKNEPFQVKVRRGEIVVKSAELEFVDVGGREFAHLMLHRFGGRTNGEWDGLVQQILGRQDLAGIVLDMRGNPGGFFDGAIDVASEFIPSGLIVTQQGKYQSQDFNARGNARLANFHLVVLVNRGSASASEIVAGALRDRLGTELIGEKTFGKGTVQDRVELVNGGGLHITIARWLLPGGSWIHHEGLVPDVEIKDNPETEADEQLLKAIESL